MHAAVGPNPMLGLGQLGHRPGPGQGPGHQDTIDFSRLQDAFKQNPEYLGMKERRDMGEIEDREEREEREEKEEREEMETEERRNEEKDDEGRRIGEEKMIVKETAHLNNNIENKKEKDLSDRVAELQDSLDTLRKESESRILKLQMENDEASRVIQRLQDQLKQQTEINLKNSLMNLKRDNASLFLGSGMPPTPPTSLSGQHGLEMLLMERAKAMHESQALKQFQGFAGQGFGFRGGLFPAPVPNQMRGIDSNFSSEDLLNRWRNLPPNIQEDNKCHITPSPSPEKRDSSPEPPVSPPTNAPSLNGISKPCSDNGSPSPHRTESASPVKSEDSNLCEMYNPELPSLGPVSPYSSSNLGLPVPSLMSASRIPKSDPMEAKLQEMLRVNIEKKGAQILDTLVDSKRVRDLLTLHNIGQRLFAKYVLGLSQGTVSELLSKPKSWDKLTEKGRDSYRKMNAWAYDENAIQLLKTLIPRKGELKRPPSQSQLTIKSPSSLGANEESSRDRDKSRDRETNKDPLSRMYKEELSRMAGNPGVIPGFPDQLIPGSNPLLPGSTPLLPGLEELARNPADFHQALSLYHEELGRLQAASVTASLCLKSPEGSLDTVDIVKKEDEDGRQEENKPKPSPFPSSKEEVHSVSPLQRMASITNSLVSQSPPVSFSPTTQRPLRSTLPPITQQQFDRYSHVNTDDTVRRIKEILSQYSISQRLYGEAVLGLSQGSVSDLLARPKPWHMLTQKGREPFIRMRIFLEDEGAVHRLVASQYKIAPDRLMRSPFSSPMGIPASRPMGKIPEGLLRPMHFENPLLPSTLRFGADPNIGGFDPLAVHRKMGPRAPLGPIPPTPNLYEMAALTSELDTQAITSKVKEVLLANNVGQKMFGESVLGLSQGSVSELLSKPKPWHMLSIKGREPFIRMQMWLNDPTNMERLAIKSNREAGKRRYGGLDSCSDRSSPLDALDDCSNAGSDHGSAKKSRLHVSDEHKDALNIAFALDPFPNSSTLEFLSSELNLDVKSITSWFQNHRMRIKQLHGVPTEALFPSGDDTQSFDPTKFRILLAHRRLEMQGGVGGGVFPFLPPSLFNLPPRGGEGLDTGLDLRFRMDMDFNDDENSDSNSDKNNADEDTRSPESTPRSRRKPAAPQWVNPDWPADNETESKGKEHEQPINGVCVRNIPVYGECPKQATESS